MLANVGKIFNILSCLVKKKDKYIYGDILLKVDSMKFALMKSRSLAEIFPQSRNRCSGLQD